jgi:hypothetical protein
MIIVAHFRNGQACQITGLFAESQTLFAAIYELIVSPAGGWR